MCDLLSTLATFKHVALALQLMAVCGLVLSAIQPMCPAIALVVPTHLHNALLVLSPLQLSPQIVPLTTVKIVPELKGVLGLVSFATTRLCHAPIWDVPIPPLNVVAVCPILSAAQDDVVIREYV